MRPPECLLTPSLAVHPRLHAGVGLRQQLFISEIAPGIPRDDDARVRPRARAVLADHIPFDARHHVRHAAAEDALLRAHIPKVLAIERGHVERLARGLRDRLRVARPAEALVPLRAVGGDFEEIVLHPPDGVAEEPVDLLTARRDLAGLRHIAAQVYCLKPVRLHRRVAVDFHIAEAEEGEMRSHEALRPVGDVGKLRLRRAVVVMVELAVLQNLPRRQRDFDVLRQPRVEHHPAGQVLLEVEDQVALRRPDRFGVEAVLSPYRQRHAVAQRAAALRRGKPHTPRLLRYNARVIDLAVVDIGKGNGGGPFLPSLVGLDQQCAIRIQLRDGVQAVTVEIGIAALESQAALEPAFAKPELQRVFTRPEQAGHIIGLRREVKIVGVITRCKVLVANLISVEIYLIDAEAADVQPRRSARVRHMERFAQDRRGLRLHR